MFSVDDEVKTTVDTKFPIGEPGTVIKVWTGTDYQYDVKFLDGSEFTLDEEHIEAV